LSGLLSEDFLKGQVESIKSKIDGAKMKSSNHEVGLGQIESEIFLLANASSLLFVEGKSKLGERFKKERIKLNRLVQKNRKEILTRRAPEFPGFIGANPEDEVPSFRALKISKDGILTFGNK